MMMFSVYLTNETLWYTTSTFSSFINTILFWPNFYFKMFGPGTGPLFEYKHLARECPQETDSKETSYKKRREGRLRPSHE